MDVYVERHVCMQIERDATVDGCKPFFDLPMDS